MKRIASFLLLLISCLVLLISPSVVPTTAYAQTGTTPEIPEMASGGSSPYTKFVIDDSSGSGFQPSIAYNTMTNTPYISYYRLTGQLMLAHPVFSGGNCGPNSSWWCMEIASNVSGGNNSIDIYHDPANQKWKLTVVYQNLNSDSLWAKTYACSAGQCAWNEQMIDQYTGTDDVMMGYDVSAKYDSKGVLHVAYYWMNLTTDKPDGLKYAYFKGGRLGNCGYLDLWQCYMVDSGDGVGGNPELTLVNDIPMMAYKDGGNFDLKFAMYLGSDGHNPEPCNSASNWFCTTYDQNGNVGSSPSITGQGRLQISYLDITNGTLKLFNMGQIMVIDNMSKSGTTQIRQDAKNKPVIAYTGEWNGRKVFYLARPYEAPGIGAGNCGTINNINRWWCEAVDYDVDQDNGDQIAMTVTPNNQILFAYIEQVPGQVTSGKLKFAYENKQWLFLPSITN